MNTYIYLHGLYSSRESFKFQAIKERFHNAYALEWTPETDIDQLLENSIEMIRNWHSQSEKLVLVGDSMGGNFACQLKERLKKEEIYVHLVLINPLLDICSVNDLLLIPESVRKYIRVIKHIQDALIFISKYDEVIDFSKIEDTVFRNSATVYELDDVHRCPKFIENLNVIDKFVG